jgi:DNA (cytosine-5)-methyltransferase 1
VENEPFCLAVLKTHWPNVPKHNDIRTFNKAMLNGQSVDILTGGFPCQGLSVAGLRKGLADERSGLFHELVRVADELAPRWLLIENVPGLLSSPPEANGRDMQIVLGSLTGFWPQIPQDGWQNSGICVGPKRSIAWCLLDSQYFGVAQRRERLFFVSGPRIESAFAVLFDAESGCGDFTPRSEAGQNLTGPLGGGAYGTGRRDEDDPNLAVTLSSGSGVTGNDPSRRREDDSNLVCGTLKFGNQGGQGLMPKAPQTDSCNSRRRSPQAEDITATVPSGETEATISSPERSQDRAPNITTKIPTRSSPSPTRSEAMSETNRKVPQITSLLPFDTTQITSKENRCNPEPGDPCHPLSAEAHPPAVAFMHSNPQQERLVPEKAVDAQPNSTGTEHMSVRRLTPTECCRLQGFPAGWTVPNSKYWPRVKR